MKLQKTLRFLKQTPKHRNKTAIPAITAIMQHCGGVLAIVIRERNV